MARKPDRFERMVEQEYKKWLKGPQKEGWLSIPSVLLRRQHRAYVQMVEKRMKERVASEGSDIRWNQMVDSYCQACMDIGSIFKHYKR